MRLLIVHCRRTLDSTLGRRVVKNAGDSREDDDSGHKDIESNSNTTHIR